MDLDDVANELYAMPPEAFTAARTAKVTEARNSGNRELAKTIGELRRPTASASIVNLLVRGRPDLVEDLLALADDLRRAQAALAGDDMRRLSARRNEVVSAVLDEARRLASQRGRPLTAPVESELSATLLAALGDPAVAAAVRSGRLTAAVHYSGFGPAEFGTAEFGTAAGSGETAGTGRRTRPAPVPRTTAPVSPQGDDDARQAALAAAKAAQVAAQSRLDELERAAGSAVEKVLSVQQRRDEAAERCTELERLLSVARNAERQAARELRFVEAGRDRAQRLVQAARRTVEQAQQAKNPRTPQ